MTFNLKGWSAFYKTAKGDGTITCSNGQKARVKIKATGGGRTDLLEGGSPDPALVDASWLEIEATGVAYAKQLAEKS